MRLLLGLLLLTPQDATDSARTALLAAVKATDRLALDRAAAELVKGNNERCAPALAAAVRTGLSLITDLEKERRKWQKEAEAQAVVRDKNGRQLKGDFVKWAEAKRKHDDFAGKIDNLQSGLPRAAVQISKLTSPAAAQGMIQVLREDGEWYPRACSAETLGKIQDPAVLPALLAQAKIESVAAVRVALADGLAPSARTSEEARKVLTSWTESPYWQLRLAAARALAASEHRPSAFTLINMLVKETGRMKSEINESLKKLTGVDKHGEHAAWKAWWEESRDEFLEGRYSPRASERSDPRGLSTFYGIPLVSDRLVFIIDCSTSMTELARWRPDTGDGPEKLSGDRALDVAKFELKKIIRLLPEGAEFDILILAGGAPAMLGERLIRAGGGSRESAIKFVDKLAPVGGGTDILASFTRSYEFAGGGWNAPLREDSIDTICFLSDGCPSAGLTDRTQLVDRILDTLRFKKVAVQSVAVAAPNYGVVVMKALADGTGGKYIGR